MSFWRWLFGGEEEPKEPAPRPESRSERSSSGSRCSSQETSSTPSRTSRSSSARGTPGRSGSTQSRRRPPPKDATSSQPRTPGSGASPARLQNLYLDFSYHRESRGRCPNLRTTLQRIHRRHAGRFLPELAPGEDILDAFVELLFPDGLPGEFFISNVAQQENRYRLVLRPAVRSPRLDRALPPGVTLGVSGYLFDNVFDPDNPVLSIDRVVELAESPARSFERRANVQVFSSEDSVYPRRNRRDNLLTQAFLSQLPPCGVETRRRLESWRTFLSFCRYVSRQNARGVRYLQVEVLAEGLVRFLVVFPDEETLEKSRRFLRSQEIGAFRLEHSRDPWEFLPEENYWGSFVELDGQVGPIEQVASLPGVSVPWEDPVAAWVTYRLNEQHAQLLAQLATPEEKAATASSIAHEFPPQGFLSRSRVGELSLISRQEKAVETLSHQGGYAPFLSAYLFDITRTCLACQHKTEHSQIKSKPKACQPGSRWS